MSDMEKDARFEQLEKLVNELLEARLKQIPDVIKDLIPADLQPEEKLAWIEQQEKKGLFKVVTPMMMTPGKGLGTGPYTGPGTAPGTGPGTEIMGMDNNVPMYPQWQDQNEAEAEQEVLEQLDQDDELLKFLDEIDGEETMVSMEGEATKAQVKQVNRNTL